jgi:hypothetical protein
MKWLYKVSFVFLSAISASVQAEMPVYVPLGFSALGASALAIHTLASYRSYKASSLFKRKKVTMRVPKSDTETLLIKFSSDPIQVEKQDLVPQDSINQNIQGSSDEVFSDENKKTRSFLQYLSKDQQFMRSARAYSVLIVGGAAAAFGLTVLDQDQYKTLGTLKKEHERLKREKDHEVWLKKELKRSLQREKEKREAAERRLADDEGNAQWIRNDWLAMHAQVQDLRAELEAARRNAPGPDPLGGGNVRQLNQEALKARDAAIQRVTLAEQRIKALEAELAAARAQAGGGPAIVTPFAVRANWVKLISQEADPMTLDDVEDNQKIVCYSCKHYCLASSYDGRSVGGAGYKWDGSCMTCRCSSAGLRRGTLRINPNDKDEQYFVPN